MERSSTSSGITLISEKGKKNMNDELEEHLLLKSNTPSTNNPKGGLRTMPFIIANESMEKVASYGLTPNMILYLMKEYNMKMTTGSNLIFLWSAATNLMPVFGAFLADSFVGRFPMIGYGSIISLLGMILLWLTTMIPQARPPPCDEENINCTATTTFQLIVLCSSFGLISVGAGGIRSSSLAFGADQLKNQDNPKTDDILESYFSWYYVAMSISIFLAVTCIVYIQDAMGWSVGFGVPVVLMFFAALSFYMASSFYVKLEAKSSLLTGLIQVIVVAYKNRDLKLSSNSTNVLYNHKKGSMRYFPSDKLRFLNKACIIKDSQQDSHIDEEETPNSWTICTVDQVEELKALIKVIPIWSTGILLSINISQSSFQVLQATSMDRHVTSSIEIPAGSFTMFTLISATVWIFFYDRVILPMGPKLVGRPIHLTTKQRMGIGIFLSFLAMLWAAIVESVRRQLAINQGYLETPQLVGNMSAMWIVPQYLLLGLAEAMNAIAQNEFYFSEFPRSMSSISLTLNGLGMAGGSLLASFVMNSVDQITSRGGRESWVSSNINEGRYDYYYYLLTGLSLFNTLYFLLCCWSYGPCEGEDEDEGEGCRPWDVCNIHSEDK